MMFEPETRVSLDDPERVLSVHVQHSLSTNGFERFGVRGNLSSVFCLVPLGLFFFIF